MGRHEEKGGSGLNWETGIDVCALPHVKQITSGNLLYIVQGSQLGPLGYHRGPYWDRAGVGGRLKREEIYVYT